MKKYYKVRLLRLIFLSLYHKVIAYCHSILVKLSIYFRHPVFSPYTRISSMSQSSAKGEYVNGVLFSCQKTNLKYIQQYCFLYLNGNFFLMDATKTVITMF